jgi:hypothetical protein
MGYFKNLIVLIFPFLLFSANLEILKKIEKIKIEGDSIFKEFEIKIKVLNQEGVSEAGTQNIEFDENSEILKILYGRVINEKETINIKDYSINIYTNQEVEDYPFLYNKKITSISFLGVKINSLIEYKYKKSSKFEGKYDEIFIFRENYPLKEKILEIEFPENLKFNYKIKGDIKFEREKIKNKIKYKFFAKDLKEIKDEYNKPPDYLISPFVFITNYNSWDEIFKEFKEKYFDSKRCEDFEFKNFLEILKEIKVADVSYNYTGFYPDSCERALRTKFGTIPERTYLMIKRMENPEILCIFSPLLNPDTLFPGNSWIEGILIKEKEKIYDPSFKFGNLNYYPYSKRKAIFINKQNFYIKEIPPFSENFIKVEINIDLKKNYLNINYKTGGYFDKFVKENIFYFEKEEKEKFLKDVLSGFGEFEKEKIEIKNLLKEDENLEIEINANIKDLITKIGNFKIIEIPSPFIYPLYISKINEERENPYLNEENFYLILKISFNKEEKILKEEKFENEIGKFIRRDYENGRELILQIEKNGLWEIKEIKKYNELLEKLLSIENRIFIF